MPETKTANIYVKVEPSVYARLQDEKARQRRTMGDLVREALAEWIRTLDRLDVQASVEARELLEEAE